MIKIILVLIAGTIISNILRKRSEIERENIIKNAKKKMGQVTQETYINWKRGKYNE